MSTVMPYLLGIAMLATLVTLALGVFSMLRQRKSGVSAGRISNKLMQYRVLFQGVALLIFALMMWIARH